MSFSLELTAEQPARTLEHRPELAELGLGVEDFGGGSLAGDASSSSMAELVRWMPAMSGSCWPDDARPVPSSPSAVLSVVAACGGLIACSRCSACMTGALAGIGILRPGRLDWRWR